MPYEFHQSLFDQIPVGLLTLDSTFSVVHLNAFARDAFDLEPGADFTAKVHPDSQAAFEQLLTTAPGQQHEIQLQRQDASTYTRCKVLAREADTWTLCFEDTTEVAALASQLKTARQPERRFVHEISNALTTTIGYTELIKLMIEEDDELSGERLSAVRRYEEEVFEGLRKADALIKNRRLGAAQQVSAAVPIRRKHVLVVDDEPQITEFLAELLTARHYKVTSFTDGKSALEYYRTHITEVDLVIMDQVMPEMSGITLATELLSLNLEQPIVLCTGDEMMIKEQSAGKLNIRHFLSKPIDINELTEMVSAIVDEKS
ncbi:MAG: response regulator [Pseudomonadales bacterium]